MKYVLIVLLVLILIALAVALLFGGPQGPSYEEVAHRAEPTIVEMAPQKVIVVTAKGNPNEAGKLAFATLMKAYFKTPGVPKGGPAFQPPRARWPLSADVSMEEWIGRYAMPVPESTTALPEIETPSGMTIDLTTWKYGKVAEMLHVGSYASETANIEKLKAFITDSGYEIAGEHEEEYLKGPGMLFAGNPDDYLTILRYEVKKVEAVESGNVIPPEVGIQ